MRRFIAVILVLLAGNAFAIERPSFPAGNDVREIRAAVICYGGVSLAIYMYGNARELHHLAQASSALECDATKSPAACMGVTPGNAWDTLDESAKHYYAALVDLWTRDGVRPRFIIDVISGTSAGGINGVFLAKALTHNGPIERLREIWFREADINRLAGRPWYLRAGLRLLRHEAALGGDAWLDQLYLALQAMDSAPRAGQLQTLLAPGQPLDLVVTATDFYGSERTLEIGDPATSSELRYDHVFRFSAQRNLNGDIPPGNDDFDEKIDNVALAYAARSSASFPVAFPAIRIDQLRKALNDPSIDTTALAARIFKDRLAANQDLKAEDLASQLYLVDGGVLDNRPFDIAHNRVKRRSPARETERIYLYLEPDPSVPREKTPATDNGPSPLAMFWHAKTTIPGSQPLAADLIDIAQHNKSVDRINEIVRKDDLAALSELPIGGMATKSNTDRPSVASRVEQALGVTPDALAKPARLEEELRTSKLMGDELRDVYDEDGNLAGRDPGLMRVRAVRRRVEEEASKGLPLVEDAYKRLRVESVLDQFARVMASSAPLCGLPEDYEGPRVSLMREVVRQWSVREKLTGSDANPALIPSFLEAFDLGYLRRRLRFVNDWLNEQYPRGADKKIGLTREQIEKAQRAIGRSVDTLSLCLAGGCLADVSPKTVLDAKNAVCGYDPNATPHDQARKILDDPQKAAAINALAAELRTILLAKQDALLGDLYREFVTQTAEWKNEQAARAVLARYLGFGYWDRVGYPYTAFSGIGDMTHIDITRMSPNDAKALSDKKAAKLKGAELGHFGAFFDSEGRQRDYVWGRLDGAERLLGVLGFKDDTPRQHALFEAVINEEAQAAKVDTKVLASMRECVETKNCPSPKKK